jgi:D-beta-D-heptose 7-phosphate kinase/D-beta-D-heptose 1-phosphate adenosyltransferase
MEVVAGLNAVDAVIGFEDDTPEHLIDVIRPDVLVKGGDYKSIEDVVGFAQVQAYGGVVKVLGEVENLSTTRLISKIRAPQDASTS